MAVTMYNRGLALVDDWNASTGYRALLLKGTGYTLNRDHDYVSDLTPASNECTATGYARVTLSSLTLTLSDSTDRYIYDCADPSFGSLTTGQTLTAMVVYKFITNDAASPLIAYYPINGGTGVDSASLDPFAPTINATNGLFYATGS